MAFMKVLGGGVVKQSLEWGASCLFFSIDGINIVIDCGIRLNTHYSALPDLKWLDDKRVDALLVTHAHLDHFGAAPILAAKHSEMAILMTAETAEIGQILLSDNLRLSE